jgi:hypothetical protein
MFFMTNQLVLKDALTLYAAYNNSNYGKTILEVFLLGPGCSRQLSSKWFRQWIHWRWYWKYLLRTSRIFVCKAYKPATKGRLQVYAAGQIADLDALNNPMSLYELEQIIT